MTSTLDVIYAPLMDTSTDEEIYPRFDPGAEASSDRPAYFNGSIFAYTHVSIIFVFNNKRLRSLLVLKFYDDFLGLVAGCNL